MKSRSNKKGNFFQRLTPIVRFLISLAAATAAHYCIKPGINKYYDILIAWDVFAFCYLLLCWIVFFTMPVTYIRHNASKEDGSKIYVFAMIILSSIAGMVAVLLLIKNDAEAVNKILSLLVSMLAMIFSWAIVHTVFTFHYTHLFYSARPEGGLEFPGSEKEPGYFDMAYFSFGVGCTFQVADIEVSSSRIRKLVLFHSLLSFILNTFVVALSINIVSGLLK